MAAPPFKRPRLCDNVTTRARQAAKAPKKAAAKGTRGKRKAGKLSKFTSLPLDVIFEIVGRLEPLDLLQLSRVTKSFRSLLNPGVNRRLWSAARSNVPGLPECPHDLNEAQYASLLFENKCQSCGTNCRAESVEFAIRCRLCQSCHKELIGKGRYIITKAFCGFFNEIELSEICTMLPRSIQIYNSMASEMNRVASEFIGARDENRTWSDYFQPELKAIAQRYADLRSDKEQLSAFVKERQASAKAMNESGLALQVWACRHAQGRKADKKTKINERVDTIKEKLQALGWNEKYFPEQHKRSEFAFFKEWHGYFDQHKPMTDRSWKLLEPKLVKILQKLKDQRHQEHIVSSLALRSVEVGSSWSKFSNDHLPPRDDKLALPLVEIKTLPSIIEIMSENDAQLEVNAERLASHSNAIIDEYSARLNELKENLASRMLMNKPAEYPSAESVDTMLQHPSALFGCSRCSEKSLLTTQQVFEHRHLNVSQPWNIADFNHPSGAVDIRNGIFKVIGAAEDSTLESLAEFDGKLECTCGHPNAQGKKFGYVSLVSHFWRETSWFLNTKGRWNFGVNREFRLLNDHEPSHIESLVKVHSEVLPNGPADTSDETEGDIVCRPCLRDGDITLSLETEGMVRYHLKAKHGLDTPNGNVVTNPASCHWLFGGMHAAPTLEMFLDDDFMEAWDEYHAFRNDPFGFDFCGYDDDSDEFSDDHYGLDDPYFLYDY